MSIINISYKSYPKLNMQQLESHDFFELYFLIKGNRRIFINEQSFNLSPTTLFFISPLTLHKTMGNEPSERINIYISKEFLSKSNLDLICKNTNIPLSLNEETAGFIYKILINASRNNQDIENLKATVNAILFFLQSQELVSKDNTGNSELQKIVQYINEHFNEKITISGLCNKFFIGKNSLFRLFHKNLQCTVIEYLLTLRLNHAKHLLTTTNYKVEEIAEICGFSSANYFSLIFKNKLKISPLTYRKNMALGL